MDIKNGVRGTIRSKLASIKKEKLRDVLSDEEISDICISSPLAGIFTNVVEEIGIDTLIYSGLMDEELVDKLCGEYREREYVCSIYAGSTKVIKNFEKYLGSQKAGNIIRIGICGFWHYFINIFDTDLYTMSAKDIADGAKSLSGGMKIIDIIIENKPTFCSIASSFKQIGKS